MPLFLLNPQVWIAIAVLVLAAMAAGFVKGIEWEQGKHARSQAEATVQRITTIKKVLVRDNAEVARHEAEKAHLKGELYEVRKEYERLRDVLDKRDGQCDVPPDILRLLNRARNADGLTASPGKPDATVRPLVPPAGWASGGSGKADAR